MTQPTLFPDPHAAARASDPPTSHQAADKVEASYVAQTHRAFCLACVELHPGCTSAECAQLSGLNRHEAARRLPELRHAGLVENAPARTCHVTGNRSITWRPVTKPSGPAPPEGE